MFIDVQEAARAGHDCCTHVYELMGSSVAKASTSSSSQSITADAFKLNGKTLETILKDLAANDCAEAKSLLSKLQK